ncbi:hypothetical protein SNEBB_000313 [Seison nebaliae]|nr:hypothetical protein SNEBB_000313 [Seison nebaliae]
MTEINELDEICILRAFLCQRPFGASQHFDMIQTHHLLTKMNPNTSVDVNTMWNYLGKRFDINSIGNSIPLPMELDFYSKKSANDFLPFHEYYQSMTTHLPQIVKKPTQISVQSPQKTNRITRSKKLKELEETVVSPTVTISMIIIESKNSNIRFISTDVLQSFIRLKNDKLNKEKQNLFSNLKNVKIGHRQKSNRGLQRKFRAAIWSNYPITDEFNEEDGFYSFEDDPQELMKGPDFSKSIISPSKPQTYTFDMNERNSIINTNEQVIYNLLDEMRSKKVDNVTSPITLIDNRLDKQPSHDQYKPVNSNKNLGKSGIIQFSQPKNLINQKQETIKLVPPKPNFSHGHLQKIGKFNDFQIKANVPEPANFGKVRLIKKPEDFFKINENKKYGSLEKVEHFPQIDKYTKMNILKKTKNIHERKQSKTFQNFGRFNDFQLLEKPGRFEQLQKADIMSEFGGHESVGKFQPIDTVSISTNSKPKNDFLLTVSEKEKVNNKSQSLSTKGEKTGKMGRLRNGKLNKYMIKKIKAERKMTLYRLQAADIVNIIWKKLKELQRVDHYDSHGSNLLKVSLLLKKYERIIEKIDDLKSNHQFALKMIRKENKKMKAVFYSDNRSKYSFDLNKLRDMKNLKKSKLEILDKKLALANKERSSKSEHFDDYERRIRKLERQLDNVHKKIELVEDFRFNPQLYDAYKKKLPEEFDMEMKELNLKMEHLDKKISDFDKKFMLIEMIREKRGAFKNFSYSKESMERLDSEIEEKSIIMKNKRAEVTTAKEILKEALDKFTGTKERVAELYKIKIGLQSETTAIGKSLKLMKEASTNYTKLIVERNGKLLVLNAENDRTSNIMDEIIQLHIDKSNEFNSLNKTMKDLMKTLKDLILQSQQINGQGNKDLVVMLKYIKTIFPLIDATNFAGTNVDTNSLIIIAKNELAMLNLTYLELLPKYAKNLGATYKKVYKNTLVFPKDLTTVPNNFTQLFQRSTPTDEILSTLGKKPINELKVFNVSLGKYKKSLNSTKNLLKESMKLNGESYPDYWKRELKLFKGTRAELTATMKKDIIIYSLNTVDQILALDSDKTKNLIKLRMKAQIVNNNGGWKAFEDMDDAKLTEFFGTAVTTPDVFVLLYEEANVLDSPLNMAIEAPPLKFFPPIWENTFSISSAVNYIYPDSRTVTTAETVPVASGETFENSLTTVSDAQKKDIDFYGKNMAVPYTIVYQRLTTSPKDRLHMYLKPGAVAKKLIGATDETIDFYGKIIVDRTVAIPLGKELVCGVLYTDK